MQAALRVIVIQNVLKSVNEKALDTLSYGMLLRAVSIFFVFCLLNRKKCDCSVLLVFFDPCLEACDDLFNIFHFAVILRV